MNTQKPRPEEIKEALLATAKELFLRDGIASTEMKAIASAAELSRSTLYRYIVDKNQLAFLVASEVLQSLTNECISLSTKSSASGFQKLHNFTYHMIHVFCENLSWISFLSEFDSIYRGDYPDIPEAQEYINTISRMLHRTAQFLFEGLADGSIAPIEDPLFFTSVLINTLLGLAERMLPRSHHFVTEHHATPESVLYATADILLNSIAAKTV